MVSFKIIFDSRMTNDERLPKLSKNGNNKTYLDHGKIKYTNDSSLGDNEFLIFGYKLGFVTHISGKNEFAYSLVFNKHTELDHPTEGQEHRKDAKSVELGEQRAFETEVDITVKPTMKSKSTFPYFKIEPLVTNFYVRVPKAFANNMKVKKIKIQMAKHVKCVVTIDPTGTVLMVAG